MRIGPFGFWEILIILLVIILVFGAGRLPKLGRSLGESVTELKKGFKGLKEDIEADEEREEKPKHGSS